MTEFEDQAFNADHRFWNTRRKLLLEKLLRQLCNDEMYGIASETFWESVVTICNRHHVYSTDQKPSKGHQTSTQRIPAEQAFRKFLAKSATKKPHGFRGHHKLHNVLAVTAFVYTKDRQSFEGLDYTAIDEFLDEIDKKQAVQGTKASTPAVVDVATPSDQDTAASNSETRRLLGKLGIEDAPIERASADLFGEKFIPNSEEKRLYFETYRFSKTAGSIDKSYTVINSPTKSPEKDYVDFKNFYSNSSGNQRTTKGMVLRLRHGTYLLGVINEGAALKALYISDADKTAETWTGGTLSTDGSHGVLMGRVVMRRTNIPDTAQLEPSGRLPIGRHLLKTVIDNKELTDSQLSSLRNRVDFTTERQLRIWRDGKYHLCTQDEMVRETERRLRVDDKPLFIFDNGDDEGKNAKPFHPAADEHYTFNSALDLDND